MLVAPDVPTDVKVALTKYLVTAKAPASLPTVTKSVGTAAGSGSDGMDVKPVSTGLDNIVDKTAEVAPKVVPVVAESTVRVVDKVSDTSGKIVSDVTTTVDNVSNNMSNMLIKISAVVFIILIIIIFIIIYIKKRSSIKIKNEVLEKIKIISPDESENK